MFGLTSSLSALSLVLVPGKEHRPVWLDVSNTRWKTSGASGMGFEEGRVEVMLGLSQGGRDG
jgi:hypothetical protein